MSAEFDSEMLTLEAAAKLLGISKGTIRNEIDRGKLRAKRFAERVIRIARSELERYVSTSDKVVIHQR